MQQDNVVLVDFLHMVAHPFTGLVESLSVVDDSGLEIRAFVIVAV